MDNHGDFDSVSWRQESGTDVPRPSTGSAQAPETALPVRKSRLSQSSGSDTGQLGGDAVDLAGIEDGVLECTVDTPLKENDGTKDAYISYLLTTHTDFKSFQKSTFSVRRRFTDFVFLRQTLQREYPACAVPPIPEKHNTTYVRGGGFSPDFTQRRAWSLHRLIKRITLHPVLRRATIFILFLETSDWNAQMKARPQRSNTMDASGSPVSSQGSSGFFDNIADNMLNAFSKVHKPDKRFIEVTERANKLDEDLSHVEKIISRVVRRTGDIESDYTELASNMRKLVTLEPGVEAPVQTFAGCVEETSRGFRTLKEHTDQNYLGSLRDMEAYILSVKSLLKTREQKQLDFEGLTEYSTKAASERDILASQSAYHGTGGLNPAIFIRNKMEDMRGVDHETARQDRLRKLENKIQELNREVDSAKMTSEMFDEQVVREVTDFERIKGLEFKDSLGALANQHVEFYKGVLGTWERFLADMDGEQPVDKGKNVISATA